MRPIRIRRAGRRWRPSSPSTTRVVRPAARSRAGTLPGPSISEARRARASWRRSLGLKLPLGRITGLQLTRDGVWNSTGSEHLGSPPRPRVVAALPRLEAPIGSDNGTSVNSGRRRSSRSRAASTTDVMLAGAGRMVAELLAGTTAQRGSGTTRPSRRPAPVLQRHRPAARFLGGLSPRGGQPRESRRCGSRASGAYSRMAKRWLRTSCCGRRPVPLECGFRVYSSAERAFLFLTEPCRARGASPCESWSTSSLLLLPALLRHRLLHSRPRNTPRGL